MEQQYVYLSKYLQRLGGKPCGDVFSQIFEPVALGLDIDMNKIGIELDPIPHPANKKTSKMFQEEDLDKEVEKALVQGEPRKGTTDKETLVREEHFLQPPELTEDELMRSVFPDDPDDKVNDGGEQKNVEAFEELIVDENDNVEILSGVMTGSEANGDEEAIRSHVVSDGDKDDISVRDGAGGHGGGKGACNGNGYWTRGGKGKGKAAKRRQELNIEDGKKNDEAQKKYGQSPECDRNYGKDLWRHLRTVEKWSEEKIKGTYTKKRSKVTNPLRYG